MQAALPVAMNTTPLSTTDSFELFLNSFLSQCRSPPLDISRIGTDINGLKTLTRYSAWKYVVEMSQHVLSNANEADARFITQLRLEALFRIKAFDELTTMATELLMIEQKKVDSSAMISSPGTNPNPTMYAMRLLLAEVKTMTGQGEESFQLLYMFRDELQQQLAIHDSSTQVIAQEIHVLQWWVWRVCNSIINAAIRQRLWRIAVSELTMMLQNVRETYASISTVNNASSTATALQKSFHRAEVVLMCRLSRILLQIGATKSSTLFYEQAKAIHHTHLDPLATTIASQGNQGSSSSTEDVALQLDITQALLLFGADNYEEALEIFNTVIDKERTQQITSSSPSSSSSSSSSASSIFDLSAMDLSATSSYQGNNRTRGFDGAITLEESVLAAAVNNSSICALYLRRIPEAIGRLEGLILEDPVRHMTDPVRVLTASKTIHESHLLSSSFTSYMATFTDITFIYVSLPLSIILFITHAPYPHLHCIFNTL